VHDLRILHCCRISCLAGVGICSGSSYNSNSSLYGYLRRYDGSHLRRILDGTRRNTALLGAKQRKSKPTPASPKLKAMMARHAVSNEPPRCKALCLSSPLLRLLLARVLQKGSGDDSQTDRKFFEGSERKYHWDKQTQLRALEHRPRHR
jgi:hypothetical protein